MYSVQVVPNPDIELAARTPWVCQVKNADLASVFTSPFSANDALVGVAGLLQNIALLSGGFAVGNYVNTGDVMNITRD